MCLNQTWNVFLNPWGNKPLFARKFIKLNLRLVVYIRNPSPGSIFLDWVKYDTPVGNFRKIHCSSRNI